MKHLQQFIGQWGIAFLLFLVVVSAATTITLNCKSLYYFDVDHLNIEETSGIKKTDIKKNYDALIAYNQFTGPKKLEFPTLPMSQSGRKHFEEVKVVFLKLEGIGIVSFVLIIILGFRKKLTAKVWKRASMLIFGIPVILGIVVGVAWEWLFVMFHQIVFGNEDWLFDPVTDPIINILPDEFFFHSAAFILGIVIVCGIGCFFIYKKTNK